MSDESVPRYTVAIDEPRAEMVRCAVKACGHKLPKHEAYRVTVERWESIMPGHTSQWTRGRETPWLHHMRTWSAAAHARLTAAAGVFVGGYPTPTHEIHTYTGYACCEEHAGIASKECPA